MTLQELRGKPHLSCSSISNYIECSLCYKFSYIDKLQYEFVSDALVFGSEVHKTLEVFNKEKVSGRNMGLDELLGLFEEHWRAGAEGRDDIRYKDGKDYGVLLEEGRGLLRTFFEQQPQDDFQILAVEHPFSFEIPGLPIPVIGAVDLISEDEKGTVIISDFKTAAKAYSSQQIDQSLQLTLYQMAAKANGFRDREILLRFDCLIKTKVPKFEQYYTSRTDDDCRRAEKLIRAVWEGIERRVYVPNPNSWKCNFCEHKSACDEWFLSE